MKIARRRFSISTLPILVSHGSLRHSFLATPLADFCTKHYIQGPFGELREINHARLKTREALEFEQNSGTRTPIRFKAWSGPRDLNRGLRVPKSIDAPPPTLAPRF